MLKVKELKSNNKEDNGKIEGIKSNGTNRLLFSEENGERSGSRRNDEASDFLRRNVSSSSGSEQEKGLVEWAGVSKCLLFERDYLKGENEPTLDEIEDEMKKRGFGKDGTHSYILKGKDGKMTLRIFDLHPGNFVKNKDGLFCIDPVIRFE